MTDPRLDLENQIMDPVSLGHRAALAGLRPASPDEVNRAMTVEQRATALNEAATSLSMFETEWWIESRRGLAMPRELRKFSLEDILRHGTWVEGALDFRGSFVSYSWVQVGKIVGSNVLRRVSGLCAAFERTLVLSGAEPLDEDTILHVPILAVDTVEPVSRSLFNMNETF